MQGTATATDMLTADYAFATCRRIRVAKAAERIDKDCSAMFAPQIIGRHRFLAFITDKIILLFRPLHEWGSTVRADGLPSMFILTDRAIRHDISKVILAHKSELRDHPGHGLYDVLRKIQAVKVVGAAIHDQVFKCIAEAVKIIVAEFIIQSP